MPYNKMQNGINRYILGTKNKNRNSISSNMKKAKTVTVNAAFSILTDSVSFFPSITTISNLALAISIKINTTEVKMPNSAKFAGEKYFGRINENRKLMI